jgi:hypothetical protein
MLPELKVPVPHADFADIPKLMARLGVRRLPADILLSGDEQVNYTMTLSILAKMLPPNSNITGVKAVRYADNAFMAVRHNADGTATLLVNVRIPPTEWPRIVREGSNLTYKMLTGQGMFNLKDLNAANIMKMLILHEVGHAQFIATRKLEVVNATKAANLADFWAAIKDLPGAERRNLERSWRLFDAWRSTIRTQFPKYAAMTPGEFYAVYLSLYDLKKPIPEPMTNLFNAMFGPGAPMGQTKGSPISYPFN